MDNPGETTIFLEDDNIRITNLSITIGSKNYPLSDITAVNEVEEILDPTCLGLLVTMMVLSFSAVIFFKHWYWIPPYIACLLLFFASLIFSMFTTGKSTRVVQIQTVSGKSNILKSKDWVQIKRVVAALREALTHSDNFKS